MPRFVPILFACAVVGVVGLCSTDPGGAPAQDRDDPEPVRLSPLWPGAEVWELMLLPSVRAELDLDADQIKRIDSLLTPLRTSADAKSDSRPRPAPSKTLAWIPSIRLSSEQRDQVKQSLRRSLSGWQWYRLNQIRRQSMKIGILVDPEMGVALQLTPPQSQVIRRIITRARAETNSLLSGHSSAVSVEDLPEPTREAIEQVWDEAGRRSREVLGDEQRILLGEMLGEPFPL